jgi:hypothetical protein
MSTHLGGSFDYVFMPFLKSLLNTMFTFCVIDVVPPSTKTMWIANSWMVPCDAHYTHLVVATCIVFLQPSPTPCKCICR